MNIDACYKIGLVMKPHGLKGEVTISMDDISPDFSALESIFIEEKENRLVPLFISSASMKGEKAFVKFEDIDTIEEALKISKKALYLPKSMRPKSNRGEFYDDEVQDFEVTDEISGPLGKVIDVVQTGANRLLAVDYNGKEILIPINSPLIVSVNKSKRKVSVNLPEGFLDI